MNRSKQQMQFGLGTVMILTTALCVWFAWEGRPAFQQGGTVELKRALVSLAFTAAVAIGRWAAFEKAGLPGWGAVIPIYNYLLVLRLARRPWYWCLLWLIPCVNLIALIIVNMDIANRFGKSGGFGLGLSFLGFIFSPILGFGDAQLRSAAYKTHV